MLKDIFPFLGTTIRTPRLEMRVADDAERAALADVAVGGIYPEGKNPFTTEWAEVEPETLRRNFLQHHWAAMATWKPEKWTLMLTVFVGGEPVGVQDVGARDFGVTRLVNSSSWLGRDAQGKGLGTEMRAAMLEFAFTRLEADFAASESFEGNLASETVSKKNGYEGNGVDTITVAGEAKALNRWLLTRERWERHRRDDIEITGFTPECRPLFGLEE
ncbi:GNAT family N-acetyltransferase [Salininema proteolyticum]|uniref:GNAT family N-acetyltransferase n=1 Tax=Salininema proteolyticum TaxID=1607685 RepID=A0ABV8U4M2_9ACTN